MRVLQNDRTRRETGAAVVEFALIAMVLLTLMVGIIQFAIFFWSYQVGAHSAREGARVAAVDPCNTPAIETRVIDRIGGASPDAAPSVDVDRLAADPSGLRVGDEVKVTVNLTSYNMGLFPFFTGAITKSATARVEHVPAAGGC